MLTVNPFFPFRMTKASKVNTRRDSTHGFEHSNSRESFKKTLPMPGSNASRSLRRLQMNASVESSSPNGKKSNAKRTSPVANLINQLEGVDKNGSRNAKLLE